MEFNMAGKAIVRAFLILALIGAAHMIKPFSIKSVTQHLLYSTRSFRFVLPVGLRDKFDHANHLAINLSNSLFEAGDGTGDLAYGVASDFAFGPINVQPLDEVNKSATRQKSCPKKSAPAKRVIRPEKRSTSDLISMSGLVARVNPDRIAPIQDRVMPIELPPAPVIDAIPVIAPIMEPCLTKFFPARMTPAALIRPVEAMIALQKKECEKRDAAPKARITWVNDGKDVKATFLIIGKTRAKKIGLGGSECEERKIEVTSDEIEIEIVEPEEDVIAPQTNEELKAGSFYEAFEKCSREP